MRVVVRQEFYCTYNTQFYAMHCYAISFFGSKRKHLSYISTICGYRRESSLNSCETLFTRFPAEGGPVSTPGNFQKLVCKPELFWSFICEKKDYFFLIFFQNPEQAGFSGAVGSYVLASYITLTFLRDGLPRRIDAPDREHAILLELSVGRVADHLKVAGFHSASVDRLRNKIHS